MDKDLIKLKLSNLWFDFCWLFWSEKRREEWRNKSWSWTGTAAPLTYCGEQYMTKEEKTKLIHLMEKRTKAFEEWMKSNDS